MATPLQAAARGGPDATVPGTFATIQAAVDHATDVNGDGVVHIMVSSGTYAENVRIHNKSNITLQGADASTTIISGVAMRETVDVERSNHISILDFTITHGTPRAFGRVLGGSRGEGIEFSRVTNSTISGTIITGNPDEGIKLGRSDNNTITGNTVMMNGRTGIKLDRSDGNMVANNESSDNGDHGIDLSRSGGNMVQDNDVLGNADDGIRLKGGDGNDIVGNLIDGNVDSGLRLRDTVDTLASGNTITNNGEWGIRTRDGSSDDFGAAAGIQPPTGDNTVMGNTRGPLRQD